MRRTFGKRRWFTDIRLHLFNVALAAKAEGDYVALYRRLLKTLGVTR
jgi:hypothetical protein